MGIIDVLACHLEKGYNDILLESFGVNIYVNENVK